MTDIKIFAKTVEPSAQAQIDLVASQSAFAGSKIRIMPDVHAGVGCVVGFTAKMNETCDMIIPNLVGVDIGCGMLTWELENGFSQHDLEYVDMVIRRYVPSGFEVHNDIQHCFSILHRMICNSHLKDEDRIYRSMGTLGGGNHFIEIDKDDEGRCYLVIHTGSRNLGKQVADYYQKLAVKNCGKKQLSKIIDAFVDDCKAKGEHHKISSGIAEIKRTFQTVPQQLAYLEGDMSLEYQWDMRLCQQYAQQNRLLIAAIIQTHTGVSCVDSFETVHNYISDKNTIRKGAVSAKLGERLLIPMNMRDGSLICTGKGNDDWNQSAPHGAGRIMSRAQARSSLNMDEFQQQMSGIVTSSVCPDTLDESPMAYKPMQEIIDSIGDTVSIDKIIKPIYNFKAIEQGKRRR